MKDNTYEVGGIVYEKPTVTLLNQAGLEVSEVAARTCYNSFDKSDEPWLQEFPHTHGIELDSIEDSKLLDQLAWVHHHHSILEHTYLSYYVEGVSRGVLQEHARHRMQNISVQSTRYTMSSVLNAFVASARHNRCEYGEENVEEAKDDFHFILTHKLDMFVTQDLHYNALETDGIFDKLMFQVHSLGWEVFITQSIAKSSIPLLSQPIANTYELFEKLEEGKNKRNVGDIFKHIVTDNWKTNMVITFNLRSLRNFFELRDSGAAWFQMRELAKAMKEATPEKYLKLIDKKVRDDK